MTETQSGAPVPLPEDFETKQHAWYKSVAGVFARVEKKDVADIPLDVWKKLIRTTYDGIDVNPLYTRADETGESAVPGGFPFVRGTDASRYGWGVTETFRGAPAEVNKAILHALYNGTTDLVLDFAEFEPADLATVLKDVLLDLAPIHLRAGNKLPEAAEALYKLVGDVTPTVTLGATPLTSVVDGSETVTLEQAVALAESAPKGVRAITVDAVSFANQGATDAQEIGFALAAGVEYLRALTAAGLSTEAALGQIVFRFAATDDQFAQIAKFRAARQLWARIAEVLGAAESGAAPQYAVTAPAMFSQRDPWVNMLRVTVAAFAAGVGGATSVEVLPFDYAVPGGLPNTSRTFAHRIARNTNLLLLEESHLGHVIDPAGGSYYVENLTDELADKAWSVFTKVEAAGGYSKADMIRTMLDESFETTRNDIAHRRKQLTGINEFPNLLERPLPAELRVEPAGIRRWAAEFEALRNRSDAFLDANGKRPQAVLIPLGPLAKHNIRTGFATNLLASGGIEALNPGQLEPGTAAFDEAAASAPIAVICGTDPEYAASGQAALAALRKAGNTVLLAGAPSSFEGASDAPDGYLNMKIDAAKTLSELLSKLGA